MIFNKQDNDKLRELYHDYKDLTISKLMNRPIREIKAQARTLGLYKYKEKHYWEKPQKDLLLITFKKYGKEKLCVMFGRPYISILNQYNRLILTQNKQDGNEATKLTNTEVL